MGEHRNSEEESNQIEGTRVGEGPIGSRSESLFVTRREGRRGRKGQVKQEQEKISQLVTMSVGHGTERAKRQREEGRGEGHFNGAKNPSWESCANARKCTFEPSQIHAKNNVEGEKSDGKNTAGKSGRS